MALFLPLRKLRAPLALLLACLLLALHLCIAGAALQKVDVDKALDSLVDRFFAPFVDDKEDFLYPLVPGTLNDMEEIFKHCHARFRVVGTSVLYKTFFANMRQDYHYERLNGILKAMNDLAASGRLRTGVDFYVSLDDHPIIAPSSFLGRRAGFVAFVSHASTVSLDIPYPDPLDILERYFPATVDRVPWESRRKVAVFRGGSTNFQYHHENFYAAPRFQLARLSARHPDVLDAGVTSFTGVDPCKVNASQHACVESWDQSCCLPDGRDTVMSSMNFTVATRMNYTQISAYKYVIEADGGLGSGRTCGNFVKLRSLVILQESPYSQYFHPMLVEGEHFVRTTHYFRDLMAKLAWLRDHDDEARRMAEKGAELMEQLCSYNVRLDFWAKALNTYARLLTNPPTGLPAASEFIKCNGSIWTSPVIGDGCVRTPWKSEPVPEPHHGR